MNKLETVSLLTQKAVLDSDILRNKEQAKREREVMKKIRAENDVRYKKLKSIRNQPKRQKSQIEKLVKFPYACIHRCTKQAKHLDLQLELCGQTMKNYGETDTKLRCVIEIFFLYKMNTRGFVDFQTLEKDVVQLRRCSKSLVLRNISI